MNIKEFCEAYKAKIFAKTKSGVDEKVEYLKDKLELKEYIPFADKRELCKNVIDACCTKEGGLIKVDSVSRYVVFTISVISKYTALEFSSGEEYSSLDEYDMLCEADLLNPILALIGEEYATCNNMLNMMMDDVITNNNTVEAVIAHELATLFNSLDGLISTFADRVKKMELDFNQVNIDKYKGLLELIPKK